MLTLLKPYLRLMRLHQPIGILLLLWPTLWALWIAARGFPNGLVFVIFVVGVVLMRSAGCIINDIADRDVDRHVVRTHMRPITSGQVSVKAALILFASLALIAFILVCFTNRLTIELSLVALLLAVIYPLMKRVTHWPQAVLGAAFAWSIPMAFAAQTGQVPAIAWWLFGASVVWTLIYDTQYAMADRAEDIHLGLKSTAILFGRYDRWVIALLQCAMLSVLLIIGVKLQLHAVYYIGVFVALILFVYQQWLIRQRVEKTCFQAFLNNHWVGLALFLGICCSYL